MAKLLCKTAAKQYRDFQRQELDGEMMQDENTKNMELTREEKILNTIEVVEKLVKKVDDLDHKLTKN